MARDNSCPCGLSWAGSVAVVVTLGAFLARVEMRECNHGCRYAFLVSIELPNFNVRTWLGMGDVHAAQCDDLAE